VAGIDEVRYTGRCPRFGVCSVNACPVDYRIRPTHPGDPEQTCKSHLRDRLAITAQAEADGIELPGRGLRPDEAARLKAGETVEVLLAEWDAREAAKKLQGELLHERGMKAIRGLSKPGRTAVPPEGVIQEKTSRNPGGSTILAVLLIVKTALFWASVAPGVLA